MLKKEDIKTAVELIKVKDMMEVQAGNKLIEFEKKNRSSLKQIRNCLRFQEKVKIKSQLLKLAKLKNLNPIWTCSSET